MRNRASLIEAVIVAIVFLLPWAYLAGLNGYPVAWDELLYMHTALNPEPLPHILNRYFHIYAQRLFLWLASGDSFRAANLYWGLLMSATMMLTYTGTRLLTGGRRIVSMSVSLLAVLFFVAQPELLQNPGVIYADYAVMLMIVLSCVLYLLALRFVRLRTPLLFVFGLVFFFALKTKETGVLIGVLIIGCGFDPDEHYSLARLLRGALTVLAGMLAGQVVLMVLDAIILGDPLFGIRPENWQALFNFNLRPGYRRIPGNYFEAVAGSVSLLAGVLAVVTLSISDEWLTPSKKTLWLLPPAMIAFLSVSMISGAWGVIPRYMVMIAPILSMLAAGFFRTMIGQSTRSVVALAAAIVLGVILTRKIMLPYVVTRYNWTEGDFERSVLMPVALLILGVLVATIRSRTPILVLGVSLCAAVILTPRAVQIFRDMNGDVIARTSASRWTPYQVFGSVIRPDDTVHILISPAIHDHYGYLGRDLQSEVWMFNLYFGSDLRPSQFAREPGTMLALAETHPTYALLTEDEWREFTHEQQLAVLEDAQVLAEANQELMLINFAELVPEPQDGVRWFPIQDAEDDGEDLEGSSQ